MSNLKWLTLTELYTASNDCERYRQKLAQKLAGQNERMKWIRFYIDQKREQRMTLQEVEQKLGHKVIIVSEKPNGG